MEEIRTINPRIKTPIVELLTPFHSFKRIPQTLLKVTFSDIRILHENANRTGLSVRKLFPISKPKNCEYQSTPARAQNSRLLTSCPLLTEKYSLPVLFLIFCCIQYTALVKNPPKVTKNITGRPAYKASTPLARAASLIGVPASNPRAKHSSHLPTKQPVILLSMQNL